MIVKIFSALLLAVTAQAGDFQPFKSPPAKIDCSNKNLTISFAATPQSYVIYDKNSSSIKLLRCEKIQIQDLQFFTVLFSHEIHEGSKVLKVLTYEVVLADKKLNSLRTTRSETVDQIELSGDSAGNEFDSSIKTEWGTSNKDKRVMLKIEINTKNEKPFSYVLKLNPKLSWFEN